MALFSRSMQTDRRSPPASTKHQGKHVAVSLDCIVLDGAFLGMLDNEVGVTEGVILGEGVVVVVDDDGGVLAVDEVLERAECDSVFWCEIHDEGVIIGVLAAVDAVVPVASLLPPDSNVVAWLCSPVQLVHLDLAVGLLARHHLVLA